MSGPGPVGGWDTGPQAARAHTDRPAPADETGKREPPKPVYGSVDEFVRGYLARVWRPRIDGHNRRWAADWWNYPEAVSRLTALWRAWEALRLDGATGASIWWRDHFDHHIPILTGRDGPFEGLTSEQVARSMPGQPLPCAPPPAGDFPDERDAS